MMRGTVFTNHQKHPRQSWQEVAVAENTGVNRERRGLRDVDSQDRVWAFLLEKRITERANIE